RTQLKSISSSSSGTEDDCTTEQHKAEKIKKADKKDLDEGSGTLIHRTGLAAGSACLHPNRRYPTSSKEEPVYL
ncbi:hypothetical protein V5O48_019517, partial [Marasmius crinis-equi]